jgi:hypothetical protein
LTPKETKAPRNVCCKTDDEHSRPYHSSSDSANRGHLSLLEASALQISPSSVNSWHASSSPHTHTHPHSPPPALQPALFTSSCVDTPASGIKSQSGESGRGLGVGGGSRSGGGGVTLWGGGSPDTIPEGPNGSSSWTSESQTSLERVPQEQGAEEEETEFLKAVHACCVCPFPSAACGSAPQAKRPPPPLHPAHPPPPLPTVHLSAHISSTQISSVKSSGQAPATCHAHTPTHPPTHTRKQRTPTPAHKAAARAHSTSDATAPGKDKEQHARAGKAAARGGGGSRSGGQQDSRGRKDVSGCGARVLSFPLTPLAYTPCRTQVLLLCS